MRIPPLAILALATGGVVAAWASMRARVSSGNTVTLVPVSAPAGVRSSNATTVDQLVLLLPVSESWNGGIPDDWMQRMQTVLMPGVRLSRDRYFELRSKLYTVRDTMDREGYSHSRAGRYYPDADTDVTLAYDPAGALRVATF